MTRKNFAQALWNHMNKHITNNTDTKVCTYCSGLKIGDGPYKGGAHMFADKLKHGRVARIKTTKDISPDVISEFLNSCGLQDAVVAKWKTKGWCFHDCWVYAIHTKGDYAWNLCK